jgi:DeoR/GlpR family transcriptional regulator of sugar metabolism
VLASSEKLGAASPYAVVGLDEVSGIITERSADKALTKPYEKMKIAVIWA